MNFLADVKSLFRQENARVMMVRELEEAKASLLAAYSGKDYACAMVEYHCARIDRLKSMIDIENADV